MKKEYIFILIGLGMAVGMALVLSPLASNQPDGLEKTAQDMGFGGGENSAVWQKVPLPDYSVAGIKRPAVSTGLAGAAGTVAIFFLGWGIGIILRKRKSSDAS